MPIPADLKDAFEKFTAGPSLLNEAVRGLDTGGIAARVTGEDWTIRDVLHHLADDELVVATRIRFLLAEEEPTVVPYDEARWQRRLQYLWRSPEVALNTYGAVRFSTAELLTHCDRTAFARKGIHPERGEITVASIVTSAVAHNELHLAQIAEIRKGLGR